MRQGFLLLLFFTLLLPQLAYSTHIVGGELTYKCLGNNNYEVKLTIFRDCYNGQPWFDSPASIAAFRLSNNSLFLNQLVPLDPFLNDTLNPVLEDNCLVIPPDVCVHTTTYTTVMNLPYTPGGYIIAYQRCCRNVTINNLVPPTDDIGATYSIELTEQAMTQCNNSPVFNSWPPLFLCVNQPFSLDQSAVDPDGDSLVYHLCDPFTGADALNPMPQPPNAPPYTAVPWLAPYNVNNQIGGIPAMSIDPVTGLLTGNPNMTGQYVIGICVDEYRNGQLIGTKRRDYQVNIGICSSTTAAFFAPDLYCKGFTINVSNQSDNSDEFQWFFGDPANPGINSTLSNPSYTYPDTGTYTITLVAEPGTICADTFSTTVTILDNSLFANFQVTNADCADSLTIQVVDSSVDTISTVADWNWTLTQGSTVINSALQDPTFVLYEPGDALLTLVVTAANGCMDTLEQLFPVVFIQTPDFQDSTSICIGQGDVPLNPDNPFPGATYSWSPPDDLDNPNSPNPLANPDSTTTYSVTITDATGFCTVTKEVTIIVSPSATVVPAIDTILRGESVQLLASFDPSYTYAWSPVVGLSDPNIHNPVATPDDDITYTVTITDENGCAIERSVVIIVLELCEEPFVFIPTGFTPNGDGTNDSFRVIANNLSEVYLVVYNRWGEKIFETTDPAEGWDGTYQGKLMPPDAFGYYAEVTCVGGLKFFKKGNVTLIR